MKWIGTSWKMNHDLNTTKKYINTLKKNKYIFNLGKYMVTQRTCDIEAIMNNKKRHVPGMIVRYIFEPL